MQQSGGAQPCLGVNPHPRLLPRNPKCLLSFPGGSPADLGGGASPPDCSVGSGWRHCQSFSWISDHSVSRQARSGADRGLLHLVCGRWVRQTHTSTSFRPYWGAIHPIVLICVPQFATSPPWLCRSWSTWSCSWGPWFCIGKKRGKSSRHFLCPFFPLLPGVVSAPLLPSLQPNASQRSYYDIIRN